MRIALTVGHSILKNGCITSADGTKFGGGSEYKFNKTISKYVAKELRKNGHDVDVIICPEKLFTASTQEKGYKLSIVNTGKYDLVIELHLNAASSTGAEGCEVLYKSDKGKEYAQAVQDQLSTVFYNRGIKYTDNLYMINKTRPVCIMLETYFCTNPKEWEYARLHKGKLAKLIAAGIGK